MRAAGPVRALCLTLAVVGALAALVAAVLHFDAGVAADATARVDEEAVEELPSADLRAVPDRKQAQLAGTARTDAPPTYEAPIPEPPAEEDEDAERRARDPVLGRLDHLMASLEVDPANEAGRPVADLADVSLAALAMMSSGYTHRGRHEFKIWMSRALRLVRNAHIDHERAWTGGEERDVEVWRRDLLAAFALMEAYGMTESPLFVRYAGAAASSLLGSQHPDGGFGPRRGNLLCTVLASFVLKSADLILRSHQRRGRGTLEVWEQLRGGSLLCDRDYLQTTLVRASRFLGTYLGADGLADLRRVEGNWFEQEAEADGGHDLRFGPTGAIYLVASFAGEDPRRSAHALRATAWMTEHLPAHWPSARARDPYGIWCATLLLGSAGHHGSLRKSLQDGGGLDPVRDAGDQDTDVAGASTSATPPGAISLSAVGIVALQAWSHRGRVFGR